MNRYLAMSLGLALSSNCSRYRHGAVIVKDGKILAVGTNRMYYDPSVVNWRMSGIHAEAAAIKAAGNRAKGATIYVGRINRTGETMLSAPCDRCTGAIDRAGITRVVHT